MDEIIVEDLRYAYPALTPDGRAEPVLCGLDLRLPAGQVLGVLGPTSSGKTTFCLALAGHVPHNTGGLFGGRVVVAGLDTRQHRPAEMARQVGLVFQEAESQLFNMSVEDEIVFGLESLGLAPDEIDARVDWALRAVGLEGFRPRSPFQLSGGQKQRVALAAILAMRPRVLVLDAPTAELDPRGRREVFQALAELKRQGLTMVIAEQALDELAPLVDQVLVLAEGRAVLHGTPRQVFAQSAALQALGLDAPQAAEVAAVFRERAGRPYDFYSLAEALDVLR